MLVVPPFVPRSKLFESINSGMEEEFLECYAPCELRDEMKKRQLRDEMKDFTIRFLQERSDPQVHLPFGENAALRGLTKGKMRDRSNIRVSKFSSDTFTSTGLTSGLATL